VGTGPDGAYRSLLSPRLIVLVVVALLVVVGTHALQPGGGANAGLPAGESSLALDAPIATGNCPDASHVAAQAASLAGVVGRATSRLELRPAAQCGAGGSALQRFREHVGSVTLAIGFALPAWQASEAGTRRALPAALAHALRALYPAAQIVVQIQAGDRLVARIRLQ
jgi:hypothetical protein